MTQYQFQSTADKFGVAFFTLPLDGEPVRNVSAFKKDGLNDIASFLNPFMNVTLRATGPFQSDLTKRDDVVLAFLALLLLLLIESLATTIFLRTHHGSISHFGFCVKLFLEHARSFQLYHILPLRPHHSAKPPPVKPRRLNSRLLAVASAFLLLTLGLEFAILLLTNRTPRNVLNSTATFRLMQPVIPEWQNLAFHLRGSINRPCESIIIQNVNQFATRISGCVATDLNFDNITLFSVNTNNLPMRITSRIHDYGADHTLAIGADTASYSARTFFTLGDRQSRLMRAFETARQEPDQLRLIHAQLVAYLFSSYRNALEQQDSSMNLTRLRSLELRFRRDGSGGTMDVLQLPGRSRNVTFRTYVTEVQGVVPNGIAALRLGHQFFRGMSAVVVRPGDAEDLFVESGVGRVEVVSWQETVRRLNWLTMGIVVVATLVGLVVVRVWLRPATTADVAGAFVKRAVGADLGRSPVEIGVGESAYFKVAAEEVAGEVYQLGAETRESRGRESEEYERSRDGWR